MEKELAVYENEISLQGCKFTKTQLIIEENTNYNQWENIGRFLKTIEGSVQFWLGDWLLFGENKYGEMYSQALDATELDYQTLADVKYTASKVEISCRNENLSFSHHKAVAPLPPEEQEYWLDKAESEGLTRRELRQEIKESKKLPTPELPEGKYNIIYADPPWQYYEDGLKNQSRHYITMTIDEICELPINDLADDNCLLFLWVTSPILFESQKVIEAWGFQYSTVGFVWAKSKQDGTGFAFGLGNWTRSNAEYCLICRKGSVERLDASISQIIYEPKGEHSQKPAIVRDKIVQLVGDIPRVELFARQKTFGWDVWGTESNE